eukprot:NODE_493_length_7764_cov_0.561644.p1 type:complete len:622 gc:universal NODE_493_length_7764_cov_0.561644:6152-4287(-)
MSKSLKLKQVLLSKRLYFGLLVGILLALHHMRAPITDIDKVQLFLKTVIPSNNFTNLFLENTVETSPAEEFKSNYNLTYSSAYKKRFTLLIPGFGTSHLELWKSKPCFEGHLRNKIWGSPNMILALLSNKQCWLEHMKLFNGTDPEGIKLRAVKDFQSSEYFLGQYWVWARIVENLVALGYDSNDITAATYDYRLSHEGLENRDGYFTELKSIIENKVRHSRLKCVVLTHSMGGLVFFNFLKWVESPLGGNGGDGWVSDHIKNVINIAVPFLGCPKVISGVLSGEMKDTAQIGPFGNTILEATFKRLERRDLFWSWQGVFSMIPKGGNRVWGTEWYSADDPVDRTYQKCYFRHSRTCMKLTFESYFSNYGLHSGAMLSLIEENLHLTIDSVLALFGELSNKADEWNVINSLYSHEFLTRDKMNITNSKDIIKSWTNPLATTLPKIYRTFKTQTGRFLEPNEVNNTLTIHCFYGYNRPTERKYFYKNAKQLNSNIDTIPEIDVTYIHEPSNTRHGVQLGDGDGTVNAFSLSGACLEAWRHLKYNPSKIPIIVKEYKHEDTFNSLNPNEILRGGKKTADHIDILGNQELIVDILGLAVEPALPAKSRYRKSTLAMAKALNLNE